MPTVSIIIPVFNTERYLRRCLDSVLAQEFRDFEVLAVDDGSTDSSPAILRDYASRDSRVAVVAKENGGQATARNLGIERSGGEWLCFVDSDDWISPRYLSAMIGEAGRSGSDLVDSEVLIVRDRPEGGYALRNTTDASGRWRRLWDSLAPGSLEEEPRWLLVHPAGCWNKLFARRLFEGLRFPESLDFEDLATVPRAMARASRISACREPIYYYYQRAGSTSRRRDDSWRDMYRVLGILKEDFAGRYAAELDYIAAARLLSGISVRAVKSGAGDTDLREMLDFMDAEFPRWKRNSWLRRMTSLKGRLTLALMRLRAFGALRLVVDARGRMRPPSGGHS
jgi:glycosyltransferase involved in cell wall biosynthesis